MVDALFSHKAIFYLIEHDDHEVEDEDLDDDDDDNDE